jgi:hypothetical protein
MSLHFNVRSLLIIVNSRSPYTSFREAFAHHQIEVIIDHPQLLFQYLVNYDATSDVQSNICKYFYTGFWKGGLISLATFDKDASELSPNGLTNQGTGGEARYTEERKQVNAKLRVQHDEEVQGLKSKLDLSEEIITDLKGKLKSKDMTIALLRTKIKKFLPGLESLGCIIDASIARTDIMKKILASEDLRTVGELPSVRPAGASHR